jgi:hypothetical protein
MVERWVIDVNVGLVAFNIALAVSTALLLGRIKAMHTRLRNATERLRLQCVAHREQVLQAEKLGD